MTTAGDIRRQLDDDMWDSMLRRTAEYRQELLRKRAAMTTNSPGQAIEAARKIVAEWAGMPKDSLFGMAALVAADYEALIEECERLRRFVDGTIAKTAALSGFTPSVKPKLKRKIVDFYCAYCGTFQGLSGPFAYCPTCELVCRETIPIASDEPPPVFPNDCCDKLDDCCCWGPALDLKKDQP